MSSEINTHDNNDQVINEIAGGETPEPADELDAATGEDLVLNVSYHLFMI